VIIPAFAVGRTQELLYFIREIKQKGLVTSVPNFPVYVDSPLAKAATTVFAGDLTGYIDEEAKELVEDGVRMLTFDDLHLTESSEESKALNADKMPKVIISASGMCDAGRIRHHLKHNLWRPECTVVFVGYQSQGSLGRRLLEGAPEVKLFGETIAVKAQMVNFPGLSSHAGLTGLLNWIQAFSPKPKQVFVVHGDADVVPQYVERLEKLGFAVHGPELMEEYDLIENRMIKEGHTPVKPQTQQEQGVTAQFKELQRQGQALLEAIAHNKGGTNKDLKGFAAELEALIKKWDR
jgi:metallo-beta-lactamase family protein